MIFFVLIYLPEKDNRTEKHYMELVSGDGGLNFEGVNLLGGRAFDFEFELTFVSFKQLMERTNTYVQWPSRMKLGAKTKKGTTKKI